MLHMRCEQENHRTEVGAGSRGSRNPGTRNVSVRGKGGGGTAKPNREKGARSAFDNLGYAYP